MRKEAMRGVGVKRELETRGLGKSLSGPRERVVPFV